MPAAIGTKPSASPPKEMLGTPEGFLAPEVAVGKPASPASDVWALACAVLHLRSGSSPFATLEVDCSAKDGVFRVLTHL